MARPGPSWRSAVALRRFGRSRDGVAATEFAIVSSVMIMAMVGLYDFDRASWHRIEVATAASAGAMYAASHGFNSNGIVASVLGATNFSTLAATPAPTMPCGCPSGTSGVTVAACGSTCSSDGSIAGYYVTVNAQASYTFLFPHPYVTQPVVLTASAMAKLQ